MHGFAFAMPYQIERENLRWLSHRLKRWFIFNGSCNKHLQLCAMNGNVRVSLPFPRCVGGNSTCINPYLYKRNAPNAKSYSRMKTVMQQLQSTPQLSVAKPMPQISERVTLASSLDYLNDDKYKTKNKKEIKLV